MANINLRKAALIAGIALLIMAIAAGFSFGYVYSTLVTEDARTTLQQFTASEGLFRAGIMGWIIIFLLDLIVAWALYIFFKPIHENFSLLSAWLRLLYTALLGVAIVNFIYVLQLIDGANSFEQGSIAQQIQLYIHGFEGVWSMGLIIFGLHLLLLGYLAFRSKAIHWIFGLMLVIAALAYVVVHSFHLLSVGPDGQFQMMETILSIPMAVGELAFAIWLIVKGGK